MFHTNLILRLHLPYCCTVCILAGAGWPNCIDGRSTILSGGYRSSTSGSLIGSYFVFFFLNAFIVWQHCLLARTPLSTNICFVAHFRSRLRGINRFDCYLGIEFSTDWIFAAHAASHSRWFFVYLPSYISTAISAHLVFFIGLQARAYQHDQDENWVNDTRFQVCGSNAAQMIRYVIIFHWTDQTNRFRITFTSFNYLCFEHELRFESGIGSASHAFVCKLCFEI